MRTTYMDTVKSARENRKWYVIDGMTKRFSKFIKDIN